jgi:CMP/dCMP kinase
VIDAGLPKLIVTIDGPAGSGKTTVSRTLARRVNYTYVDTGALYRAVALKVKESGVDSGNWDALSAFLSKLELRFVQAANGLRLMVSGDDVTDRIRTPEISLLSSSLSALPVVRSSLLGIQRALGAEKGVVFEGRDMGTVVFPEADVKIFLVADTSTRALRRYKELATVSGTSLIEVESDMKKRDTQDSSRKIAPLSAARDATTIDSTHLTIDEVVDRIYRIMMQTAVEPA